MSAPLLNAEKRRDCKLDFSDLKIANPGTTVRIGLTLCIFPQSVMVNRSYGRFNLVSLLEFIVI